MLPQQMRRGLGSTTRIEFLSDGVFAIVMTLLVIEIEVPHGPAEDLLDQLGDLVPTFLTYGLVLLTLGALWFGNRTQSQFLAHADRVHVWLTLLMLGLVALVPFSAALLADFPTARVAVVFFGAHLTAVYAVHGLLWRYASAHPELLHDWVPTQVAATWLPSFLPMAGYAASTVLGAAVPIVGLVGYLIVPLPLVFGLFYRGLAHAHDIAAADTKSGAAPQP